MTITGLPHLILFALVLTAGRIGFLWFRPFKRCGCQGMRPCRRCDGSGLRPRFGGQRVSRWRLALRNAIQDALIELMDRIRPVQDDDRRES